MTYRTQTKSHNARCHHQHHAINNESNARHSNVAVQQFVSSVSRHASTSLLHVALHPLICLVFFSFFSKKKTEVVAAKAYSSNTKSLNLEADPEGLVDLAKGHGLDKDKAEMISLWASSK